MTVSPVASAEKIQTALTNLGTPDGFIAYDIVPLLQQLVVALGNIQPRTVSFADIQGDPNDNAALAAALSAP